jgi:hypothetical protein
METLTFMQAVLGTRGKYCIFAVKDGNLKQKFYPTMERAWVAAQDFDGNGYDAYYGLATFDDEGRRKAENAIEMGSLFLDLDCGPSKDYPDQVTALKALREFVQGAGLPKPIMVSSGYGVHAYWPLEDAAPIEQWKPVAVALKKLCSTSGLFIDPAVPADAARVLRLPGTHNRKNGAAARVEVIGKPVVSKHPLSYFAKLLKAAPASAPTVSAGLFDNVKLRIEDDPVMQRLMSNRTWSFKKIVTRSMKGTGCDQLRQIIEDQASVEEPLWRASLSVAKFCKDGEKGAHAISRQHPDYDPEETEAKLDGIRGPYTCETFDNLCGGVCEQCPFWGKIKSPIQLGAEIEEAETEVVEDEDGQPTVVYRDTGGNIPVYPFPYKRGNTGGVYKLEPDEDGDEKPVLIYMYDFYYIRRVVDPEAGECVVARLHLPRDGIREFIVPLSVATSKEEIRKCLSKEGLTVSTKKWDSIMAYTQAWIEQLQERSEADTARTQFGWTDDNMTSYVLGEREIFADKVEYNPPSSKTSFMFPSLRKKGTLEGWVEQAKFYDRDGLEPYQYVLCQALAAPLMRLTPVHAAIFDFYSDGSGHGKSTTQKFALTIYGDPGTLIVGPKDTLNSRMNRMELMKDVNLQFDEFTEFPADQTSDLIYGITDGRQKARMSAGSNEERFRGQPWSTTVTASSNYSMLSKVYASKSNPQAEVQRVLRYHVQPHNFTDKNETDVFAKSVGDHQGHAAEAFVQHLMMNKDTAKELLDTVQRKLDKACGLTMQNRFWSVQGAVTITALIMAREIGLLSYDVKKLFSWVVDLINANKYSATDAQAPIESIITEFMTEHYGEVLWIKSSQRPDEINDNGLDNLVVPEMQPRGKLAARYETDVKMLYIVLRPLKLWCTKRRFNYDSVIAEAIAKFSGGKKKIRISRGTKMNLPPVDVLQLDCSGLDIAEVKNGGSEGG